MMNLLIADDQPDVLEALRLLLKDQGHTVETASSPAQVLDSLSRKDFDLLLMDLNYARCTTSGREGLDLLTCVQALDSTLPVVAMTAWSSVDLAVEAMRMGVCDFVQKPWENTRLLETLHTQLEQGQKRRRTLRQERDRLREIEEAREIDHGLLPKSLPQMQGCSFSGARLSARSVGGDYFDLLPLDNDRAALCIADVIGKGIPAALLMSNLQAAVRALHTGNLTANLVPSEVCSRLNQAMCRNMPAGKFITFFYGLLDTDGRTFTYTNAGHSHPILMRKNGRVLRLDAGGTVLGVFSDSAYTQGQVQLESGDRLLLFTDGVTEARNAAGEEFGDERITRLLETHHALGAVELKSEVMQAIADFSNGDLQDDATLLVMAVD